MSLSSAKKDRDMGTINQWLLGAKFIVIILVYMKQLAWLSKKGKMKNINKRATICL